ncbi:glycosyltransferase family 4 protein [Noviherbaspirillum sedimenti]|uniref:Glycosyltransferase family 4 protein n=1 Tax=Noviherbaspirillum sedimenti TaxID=2320865 RepID=A0A3A3G8Y1_9BURK|nr:glycosyltransferase family 4 protein [Noviherbaspirillum sedimenti]
MMRLVIFINNLAGGGAERVAATLANYWACKQWDITIVTLGSKSLDFYPLHPAVRRVSLNLLDDSTHFMDALLQNVQRVMALRKAIKQLRPKVIMSLMSTPNVLLAFASMGITGLCTIGTEHCYPPHLPLGRMWESLRRRMYGRLSAVVALTQECAEWIKVHTSARCVPVIPNAACWPLPDKPPKIEPDTICLPERKILLAVGRLSKQKNFEVLIDVFSKIAPKHPDWDLVILGEGPDREMLESRIRDAMLGARIFMPGIAGNVGQWYSRADLYVMSSRFEGFPNVLAEALAYGVPAVSFDCDTGPRDIIRHGVDGFLVPVGNAVELQAMLERVMRDSQLRQELASRANDVRERFSLVKIADMWESLFNKLSGAGFVSEVNHVDMANKRTNS